MNFLFFIYIKKHLVVLFSFPVIQFFFSKTDNVMQPRIVQHIGNPTNYQLSYLLILKHVHFRSNTSHHSNRCQAQR